MIPEFTVESFEFFVHPTRTRFPFRYGIASMTDVPHLFVRARIVAGGSLTTGLASEGLPPKWFTKDPATTFDQDLPEMLEQIGHAAKLAAETGRKPRTFFSFWRDLYRGQAAWAATRKMPGLLANLGVSLVERAVLDALCRQLNRPLHELVRDNQLGLKPGDVYAELGDSAPKDWLPPTPLPGLLARHTVGLTDPLAASEIAAADRAEDGLPQDLESSIRAYGLCAFKIKLSGEIERDLARLRDLASLLERETGGDYLATVDANENFRDFVLFREFWEKLTADPLLGGLRQKIVAVEQPVHRDHALNDEAGAALRHWPDRPPLIIDESDGAIGDLTRALELGYVGTSHKNCKGIVKGIANACLLARRRSQGQPGLLTGEDLCNIGPVALLQDLTMMALLGIPHVERNGHHYFRGLSMWPDDWQVAVLASHPDLYTREPGGLVRLQIECGRIALGSVSRVPFGLSPLLDPSAAGFESRPL